MESTPSSLMDQIKGFNQRVGLGGRESRRKVGQNRHTTRGKGCSRMCFILGKDSTVIPPFQNKSTVLSPLSEKGKKKWRDGFCGVYKNLRALLVSIGVSAWGKVLHIL